jgi:hypothetical protein
LPIGKLTAVVEREFVAVVFAEIAELGAEPIYLVVELFCEARLMRFKLKIRAAAPKFLQVIGVGAQL